MVGSLGLNSWNSKENIGITSLVTQEVLQVEHLCNVDTMGPYFLVSWILVLKGDFVYSWQSYSGGTCIGEVPWILASSMHVLMRQALKQSLYVVLHSEHNTSNFWALCHYWSCYSHGLPDLAEKWLSKCWMSWVLLEGVAGYTGFWVSSGLSCKCHTTQIWRRSTQSWRMPFWIERYLSMF